MTASPTTKMTESEAGESEEPVSEPAPPEEPDATVAMRTPRGVWLVGLVPVVLAVAAFAPALRNGFVDWEDLANLIANPAFRGLGWAQLRWDWTTPHLGVYQPLSWM